jgi:HAE1 family hydrophobic/amphiphilic exporter-1
MWISNFSISHRVPTIVLMLALVIFGTIALFMLETDEFPEINPPVISVSVPYPGASPESVESEVVDRMEEAFSSINGTDEITSTSLDGFAIIIVEFIFEKDLQEAAQDIRDKISEIRNDLPPEMEEPIITRFDPNDLPIVSLVLTSPNLSPAELTRLADPGITTVLRGIQGVADVEVVGGLERELTVELSPEALETANVGVSDVVAALEAQNLAAPVGRVTGELAERTIRLASRIERPDQFEELVVRGAGDRLVRLGDLGRVRDGAEEPRTMALFDGRPAVGIDITKMPGESTTAVSDAIRARLPDIEATLPEGVTLEIARDSGVRVERSVEDVQESLLEGALLTVLVVFLFLGSWRSTIITGLALPVSVLASFITVWAFGFTLNTMSLLGLSLAIGILIDDAIVVRENIVRHMEMGKDHVTAAREGTSEIGLAVAATTFSIVVVFVPIAFMGGIAEQWFAPFALTIAASVLVSLLVSFSLDPMLSAVWADPEVAGGKKSWLARRIERFDRWFDRQTDRYRRIIRWALRHRIATIAIAIGSFVLALAMPAAGIIGSAFFPVQDRSEFTVVLETPPGSSLEYTRLKTVRASQIAREHSEVRYTYATIGREGEAVDEATIYVRLAEKADRDRSQQEIEQALRSEIQRLSGVTVSLATSGFGTEKQIQLQLRGPDVDVLNELAERIADEVRQVPGAVDVGLSTKGQRPELSVELARDLAGTLGVTAMQVAQALRPAFAGVDAGDWIDPQGETRDVTVRLRPESRESPADLERLPLTVQSPAGETSIVPLGQIARIERNLGPAQIEHLDRQRVVTVEANAEGLPLSAVLGGIQERVAEIQLPSGYSVSQGGEAESQAEVFGQIALALGIAVLLMYLILVVQFSSVLDPIPVMISLPLSLIGGMLALLVTGSTLNLMSMIGVILLMGIVAKNAILLIDFAKWSQRDEKIDRKSAIVEAGGVRLRPILMTSVAIVAGMLPVAIGGGEGGDFRAPLGRAVIGGVITSTLLTLLVIPTFYDILAGWRDALGRRFRRKRGHSLQNM